MRVSFLSLMLAGGLAGLAAPASAQDRPGDLAAREGAIVLEPRGAWTLDMRESKCRLARWFGSESDPHLLVIEQSAPRYDFSLTLGGSSLLGFASASELRYGMERDEQMKRRTRFATADLEDVGPAVILATVDIGPARSREGPHAAGVYIPEAATIDRVVIEAQGRVIAFETGSMERPFTALNACTSNLLGAWGLDPAQHQAYLPPSLIDEEGVLDRIKRRYPGTSRRRGEQGILYVRVIVEADGSPSDCVIENASELGSLNSPACSELRKARFEPARDAEGNAMRSFVPLTLSYRLGS